MSRQYYEVIRVPKRRRFRRFGTMQKIKLVGMVIIGMLIVGYVVKLYAFPADAAAVYLPLVLR